VTIGVAVFFLLAAGVAALLLRRVATMKARPFDATLGELRNRPPGAQAMNNREQSLAQRREELVGALGGAARGDLASIEPGGAQGGGARPHRFQGARLPVVTALGVGAVALLGTRRIFEIATKVLTLYALFRR